MIKVGLGGVEGEKGLVCVRTPTESRTARTKGGVLSREGVMLQIIHTGERRVGGRKLL